MKNENDDVKSFYLTNWQLSNMKRAL